MPVGGYFCSHSAIFSMTAVMSAHKTCQPQDGSSLYHLRPLTSCQGDWFYGLPVRSLKGLLHSSHSTTTLPATAFSQPEDELIRKQNLTTPNNAHRHITHGPRAVSQGSWASRVILGTSKVPPFYKNGVTTLSFKKGENGSPRNRKMQVLIKLYCRGRYFTSRKK